MDAKLGLIYLRVPTWAPFRLQFYCNGHNWLARKLTAHGVGYTMADNAFVRIDDWPRAQAMAETTSHREPVASRTGSLLLPALLSSRKSVRAGLPLEPDAGGDTLTDLAFRSTATLAARCMEQLVRRIGAGA